MIELLFPLAAFAGWVPTTQGQQATEAAPPAAAAPASSRHPADAELFLTFPDVPRLLRAMAEAPLARMVAEDAEVRKSLARLLGEEPDALTGRSLAVAGLAWLAETEERAADWADLATRVERVSISVGTRSVEDAAPMEGSSDPNDQPAAPATAPWAIACVELADEDTARRLLAALPGNGEAAAAGTTEDRSFEVERLGPLWAHRDGALVVLGSPVLPSEEWIALRDDPSRALSATAAPDLQLPATPGDVVLEGWQRGRDWMQLDESTTPAFVGPLLARLVGSTWGGEGPIRWRATVEGGLYRVVSTTREPEGDLPVATEPIPPALLGLAKPGSFLVLATTLDGAGLAPLVASATQDTSDWTALLGRLGPGALLTVEPLAGVMGAPPVLASLDLVEPEGFLEQLEAALAAAPGVELRVRASRYRDVPYLSISPNYGVAEANPGAAMFLPRPAVAVLGGRLVIASSSLNLKEEIRRTASDPAAAGEPAEASATPAWERAGFPAAGAISFATVDWSLQVDALLDAARAMGPMLGEEIPFDIATLPPGELVAPHLKPSFHRVAREDGLLVTRHRTALGPETWLGLAGIARKLVGPMYGFGTDVVGTGGGADEGGSEASEEQRTHAALQSVDTALAVHRIDTGRYPDVLEDLLEGTEGFPQGFLEELPPDGWGRPLRYTRTADDAYVLWSLGPDGEDQQGGGDDVVLRG